MAWTAPKIVLLLKTAPSKPVANLRPAGANKPTRSPSPRAFGAESKTGYGGK